MATPGKRPGPPPGALSWTSDLLSRDEQESFWQRVADFENAPTATDFQRLTEAGVELPDPDSLTGPQCTQKLWEVINALADLDVYLSSTDHLSDRHLYSLLWLDLLRVEDPVIPGATTHLDILGGCSEEDIRLHLKHYADDAFRRHWAADFPDFDIPPHEDPPFDRDRRLPQPY